MFWKRDEEDDDNDDIREGMEVMPAIIGILLVLLAGFQLFYRYDSWPSKTKEGVMYERDRLTGELHVVYPGDKVGLIDRITGHYGHSADEVAEDGQAPLVADAHHQAPPPAAQPIPEPQQEALEPSPQNAATSQPYYSQPYPQQGNYPPQQQAPQNYYQQPQAQQGQTVVYPVAQPVIVTVPANAYQQAPQETRQPEYRSQDYRTADNRTARQTVTQNLPTPSVKATLPQAIAATQKAIVAKPLAAPAKVIAKASQSKPTAYQMNMVASSEVQLRTEHQPVMVPLPGAAPQNPKPAFQPLVPTTAPNAQAAKAPSPPKKVATIPRQGTSTQAMDLNRDGSDEHIIQTPRADGHINISVVSEGKEILFGQGQQLQVLPTRRQGWSDLAVMNTKSGQRHVYQFDPKTQSYAKAYMEPIRAIVAQHSP